MKNFTDRLKVILEKEDLTASKFAEKFGIQRSSVSHIISGRNKPSLDFVIKVNNTFNSFTLEWLINGTDSNQVNLINKTTTPTLSKLDLNKSIKENKNIKEICFFYTDDTFKIFKN